MDRKHNTLDQRKGRSNIVFEDTPTSVSPPPSSLLSTFHKRKEAIYSYYAYFVRV